MLLWSKLAFATTVCVPDMFQHWDCDSAQPTVSAALASLAVSPLEDVIHVRWDHTESGELEPNGAVALIGHPGPAGELPILEAVRFSAAGSSRLQHVELRPQGNGSGLTASDVADLDVVGVRIYASPSSPTEPALRVRQQAVVNASRVEVRGELGTAPEDGALVRARDSASLTCTDCIFTAGNAIDGSVQVLEDAFLTMVRGEISGGLASRGGALYAGGDARVALFQTRVRDNQAPAGGGFYIDESAVVYAGGVWFCENTASNQGGAVHVEGGALTTAYSVFQGNTSGNDGAASLVEPLATHHSVQDSFGGNSGAPDAGLVAVGSGEVWVEGAVFVAHDAQVVLDGDEVEHSFFGTGGLPSSTPADHVTNTPLGSNVFAGADPFPGDACEPEAFLMDCDTSSAASTRSWRNQQMGAQMACRSSDADLDGLMRHEETARGTSRNVTDTDGDGLSDLEECPRAASSSLNNPSFEATSSVVLSAGVNTVPEADVPGWYLLGGGSITLVGPSGYGVLPVPDGSYGLQTGPDLVRQGFDAVAGERLVLELTASNPAAIDQSFAVDLVHDSLTFPHLFTIPAGGRQRLRIEHQVPQGEVSGIIELSGDPVLLDAFYLGPDADTDLDGVMDCLDTDSDGDGRLDAEEVAAGSDPRVVDSDGDGSDDEVDAEPLDADLDQDGLNDSFELALGLDPASSDTDGDGVDDGFECLDGGLINGGFEAKRGSILRADTAVLPQQLHGWQAASEVSVRLGGAGETPDALEGSFLLDLGETQTLSQVIEVDIGEPLQLLLAQRGRFGADTIAVTIEGGTVLVDEELDATDLAWTVHELDFTPDAPTVSITVQQVGDDGSFVDAMGLYPSQNLGSMGLLCLDPAEQPSEDLDNDGFSAPSDCDDTDPSVYPGAEELCDPVDHDCDGDVHLGAIDASPFYLDQDEDDYGLDATEIVSCTPPPGYVAEGGDCADDNELRHPSAVELCNDIDDDCDGSVDEEAVDRTVFYLDSDGDQHGDPHLTALACDRPDGHAVLDDDCDDTDPTVYPGAPELCDLIDNNCDGTVDDSVDFVDFYLDDDGDGFGDPNSAPINDCTPPPGRVSDDTDCDDTQAVINPFAIEICDGVDNNCSGDELDAIDPNLFFIDADEDGFGDVFQPVFACEQPAGTAPTSGDCDDLDEHIAPGAIEVCDGQDNNCNGLVDLDAEVAPTWYQDDDGDGYGTQNSVMSCSQPPGFAVDAGDCSDTDASVHPGATELCDGVDNDCDELIDADDPDAPPIGSYFVDGDGDGFGTGAAIETCAPEADWVQVHGDCDDQDADVFPGAPEACDGIDANCDGQAGTQQGYLDLDDDGYGDPTSEVACDEQPRVHDATDCDDTDAQVNPGALERCDNTIDDDCDGEAPQDEGFYDEDGDGYGVAARICGGVAMDGDCDDTDPLVNPGQVEIAGDGIDQDCDGIEPRSVRFGPVCATGAAVPGWWALMLWLPLARRRSCA